MDVTLKLWTDGAMLCIFDPALFEGMRTADIWLHDRNPAVREGKFVLIGLGEDCGFRLRITDSGLRYREKELLNDTVGPLGLEVGSGRVYASGMDVPGEAVAVYADHGAGGFFELASGSYNVTIHELNLQDVAEVERAALPDFVAVISHRSGPFSLGDGEYGFSGGAAIKKLLKELGAGE